MTDKKSVFFFLMPVLLSFILHLYTFNLDLIGYHAWRQTQTQTVIYNFSFSDNYILHPQRFDITNGTTALLYEFPLYQWVIAQINNCVGYSVAHSREISFLVFVLFLIGFYKLITKFVSREVALMANWLICFSPLLYYYCVNPLPDLLALCFAIWSLKFFYEFIFSRTIFRFILFSFFLALAALVKLPYLLFGSVFGLFLYKEFKKERLKNNLVTSLIFAVSLIPVLAWYIRAIPTWSTNPVTKGILANTKDLLYLLDCFQFNLFSSVPELLTNYASCVFLVVGIYFFIKNRRKRKEDLNYLIILFIFFSLYFLFELNTIEKVHDYYLMPFVPLIFLVVTKGLKFFYDKGFTKFIFFILFLVPITAWLRVDQRWNENKPGFVKDYLDEQTYFSKLLPDNAVCIIDFDESKFISLYYLKRNGYSLSKDQLNAEVMRELVSKGANYFITQNHDFDPNQYQDFNLEEVFQKNLRIYKINLK